MSDIVTYESAPDPKFMADRLAALHMALETYGKTWGGGVLQIWVLALTSVKVTSAEFNAATAHWATEQTKFPTPAEIIDWVKSHREDADTRALLKVAELRSKQERDAYDKVLEAKYEGYTTDDLRRHVEALEPMLTKALPPYREAIVDTEEAYRIVAELPEVT